MKEEKTHGGDLVGFAVTSSSSGQGRDDLDSYQ